MPTMTELKKLTIGGRSKHSDPRLYVFDYAGTFWATNTYWMVHADRLRVLLEHFNLPTAEAGSYSVNGKLARIDQAQPTHAAATILGETYDLELARTEVEGVGHVYAGPDPILAVYDRPNGERVFFNQDFHAWILETVEESLCYGARWKHGSLKVRQSSKASRGSASAAAFYATREKKSGGHNGPDGKWVPETWADDGEELFAILMPVRR